MSPLAPNEGPLEPEEPYPQWRREELARKYANWREDDAAESDFDEDDL